MRGALLGFAALVACTGTDGTLAVSLTTAPGSTLLAGVATLRLTVTSPHTVTEAMRGSDGSFDIALAFGAVETAGSIIVEGLDGSGTVIAVGESPPFPLSAINADVVIYMAAPRSFAAAPLALDAARSGIAVVPLAYGGVLAGGRDAAGAATDELHVYNAYDHTFAAGMMLPATRSDMAGALGTSGQVYLFGGLDGPGSATGTLWRFDPTLAPSGKFAPPAAYPELARAGQTMLPDGLETFVISGMPALELDGQGSNGSATLTARTDLADAPASGASVIATDEVETVVFCGAAGCSRVRAGAVDALAISGAARSDAAMVALAGGQIAILGGALAGTPTLDAVIIDAATGTGTTVTGALSTARLHAAAAATTRYVVVAGGTDGSGAVVPSADILDATTLALVATVPMVVPRTGAAALALPNEQVLVVGGLDATGAPSDLIELFTPDAPP